ncbi:MAG: chitobiase/beta-hexosaminidase C-terminal domain-containing protein [Verrucomicrobiota bacterium]
MSLRTVYFISLFFAFSLTASAALRLDFDDSGNSQAGWDAISAPWTWSSGTGIDVVVLPVGAGIFLDDRDRGGGNGGGAESDMWRDFLFANGSETPGEGMDIVVSGLVANASYPITLWAYDTGSGSDRSADWFAGVDTVTMTFNGNDPPPTDLNDYMIQLTGLADSNGTLVLEGRVPVSFGPAHNVFVNGLEVGNVSTTNDPPVVILPHPVINEFMADNESWLSDEDGDSSDWLELWNATTNPIHFGGWYLTDDPLNLTRWQIPPIVLGTNAYLTIFASGKDRINIASNLHANFSIDRDEGGYLALVDPSGTNVVHEYVSYPEQCDDISYGLYGTNPPLSIGYMIDPTPGAFNTTNGFTNVLKDTFFNPDRGFYDAPFFVTVGVNVSNVMIRYTTDGSEPTLANGMDYPGGPGIPISETSTLRARAYKTGFAPTDVDTHTYIFLDQVVMQPTNPPGFPPTWGTDSEVGLVVADYEMDPEVVSNALPGYEVRCALTNLPTLSIVLPQDDLFDSSVGIYANPKSRGPAWEREGSVELIYPDGTKGFQVNCGIKMQGNSSRRPRRMQKHAFRLDFRAQYGTGRLNFPLIPGNPVDSFNKLILRACFTDSWGLVSWSPSRYRPDDSLIFRDVWMKQTQLDMGHLSGRGTFMHLYINGPA